MNTKLAPFSDVHVRRAIAYATDDPGMVKALYPAGYATENVTLLPDTEFDSLGTSSQVNAMLGALPKYDFDLTAAKRELAKSAHPHGFSMTIQTFGGATVEVGAAQILASDLAKIGVTAKVREMPPNEASAVFTTPGRVSVFIINYSGIYPDPEGVLSQMLLPSQIAPSGGGLNVASYKRTEVEKLMSEQSETPDPATRLHLFGKLLGIVGAEIPYRPLFTPDEFVPLSDKYVFPTFSPWTVIADPWALDVKLAA
jgi:peptide/nickel transport system substrate-binding protein